MDNRILFLLFLIFGNIYNGGIAELNAEEETESECVNTPSPQQTSDCVNKNILEDDAYCCFFEIENHKKQEIKKCAGLTEFQYYHIKLYVKEKMDELLYRDLNIHCYSSILKITSYLFLFFLI